jgi:hypothetical protein
VGRAIAARLVAAAGAVLAIVGVFLDAFFGRSFWQIDGTVAWAGLILGAAALLLVGAGLAVRGVDGWLFAIGAVLLGYWGWLAAVTASGGWDNTGVGLWLCLAGAVLVAGAAGAMLAGAGAAGTTPAGISFATLVAGLGIVLVFPGIFLDAEQGRSYWEGPPTFGHSLGIVMLVLAIACGLAWGATVIGLPTRGLDSALTLILLGLVAFEPVDVAFGNLGDLQAGAWLALAGGILAAGGTWSARAEAPRAEPSVG